MRAEKSHSTTRTTRGPRVRGANGTPSTSDAKVGASRKRSTRDHFDGATAPPPLLEAGAKQAEIAATWPFPIVNVAAAEFERKTGLCMPSSTASALSVERWAKKLTPAQRLEVVRTGGTYGVITQVVQLIRQDGGVLASPHRELLTPREELYASQLQSRFARADHRSLSSAYASSGVNRLLVGQGDDLDRMIRFEMLLNTLQLRFAGKLDLGDE